MPVFQLFPIFLLTPVVQVIEAPLPDTMGAVEMDGWLAQGGSRAF